MRTLLYAALKGFGVVAACSLGGVAIMFMLWLMDKLSRTVFGSLTVFLLLVIAVSILFYFQPR